MGLLGILKQDKSTSLNVSDDAIVAIADGEVFDITTVKDEMISEKLMGEGIAFRFAGDKVVLCSPANGTLSLLYPTHHAYGITTKDGVELLVHIGIDTVNSNGIGFKALGKKQGDAVKAGDKIVEVDLKKLGTMYDMSTMLIVTEPSGKEVRFTEQKRVSYGDLVAKIK